MDTSQEGEASGPLSPEVREALVDNYRRFLAFVERRVGSRTAAEEVLQSAFVRSVERSGQLTSAESAVAWMFRLLRNAIADHHRRAGAESRALEGHSREAAASAELELKAEVCACLRALLPTLKTEYGEILRRVDLDEQDVSEAAGALGITANNAAVRLHRARQSLRQRLEQSCGTCTEHGCLDCSCGGKHGPGPA